MESTEFEHRPGMDDYLGTSLSGWGRSVLLALLSLDVDGRQLFRDCGLDPDVQGYALVRNPVTKMQFVWQMAENSVEDKNLLATTIVRYLNASSFYALGFGLYASSSIRNLFRRLCLYREVISSSVNMRYEETERYGHFRIIDLRPVKSHLTSVVMLLFMIRICHELKGPELSPVKIEVPWGAGEYDEAIRQETDAPISYGKPYHGLSFLRSVADEPLPSAQSQLASFQDNLCRDYLHSLEEHRHFPSRVRLKILQGLANDRVTMESIASSLHMSPRSLQRKLKSEGSRFRDILTEVRKELVVQYAANSDLSATQIGYMLGFSGIAQFAAAFKKWHGETFSEFRQRLE